MPLKPHSIATSAGAERTAWACVVLMCSALLCAPSAPAGDRQTLRVGGTGSALGTIKLLAEQFRRRRPDIAVTVLPSMGSGGAVKAAASGAIDLGLSSRQLNEGERSSGVVLREFCRTPFVMAVSSRLPVSSLTAQELESIYAGTLTTWPDGTPVRLVLRPLADVDTRLVRSLFPAMGPAVDRAHARPGMIIAETDQDAADAIERISGAVGPSSLGLIRSERRNLKALAIDGRSPAGRAYPWYKSLHFVVPQKPSPAARYFIEFTMSAEGRKLLERLGHRAVAP